jgi:anti-anti-sigma factor
MEKHAKTWWRVQVASGEEAQVTHTPLVEQLKLGDHVCWTFDDDDERLTAMAHLVTIGIQEGHKVLYVTASMRPETLLTRLALRGVPTGEALARGQLDVQAAQEMYLPHGEFDPDAMFSTLGQQITRARDEGWTGLRVVGDMAWALHLEPGAEQLTSYEAQANRLLANGWAMAVCQYDRRLFPDAELRRVASAHAASALAGANGNWRPSLRMRRTENPQGLALVGEADLSNRRAMAAVLGALVDDLPDPRQPIVIDLRGLTFADSAAAGLLVRAGHRAPAGVRLIGCSPQISRVLAMLGADQVPGLTVERRSDAHQDREAQ